MRTFICTRAMLGMLALRPGVVAEVGPEEVREGGEVLGHGLGQHGSPPGEAGQVSA